MYNLGTAVYGYAQEAAKLKLSRAHEPPPEVLQRCVRGSRLLLMRILILHRRLRAQPSGPLEPLGFGLGLALGT